MHTADMSAFLAPDTYNIPERTIYGQTQYKEKKRTIKIETTE
jgi:hypothetical protein